MMRGRGEDARGRGGRRAGGRALLVRVGKRVRRATLAAGSCQALSTTSVVAWHPACLLGYYTLFEGAGEAGRSREKGGRRGGGRSKRVGGRQRKEREKRASGKPRDGGSSLIKDYSPFVIEWTSPVQYHNGSAPVSCSLSTTTHTDRRPVPPHRSDPHLTSQTPPTPVTDPRIRASQHGRRRSQHVRPPLPFLHLSVLA